MSDVTTIQINRDILEFLKSIKKHPRQSYNEVLSKMVDSYKEKSKSQYDQYLHEIQKNKMKELWDNKEDEEWEHA